MVWCGSRAVVARSGPGGCPNLPEHVRRASGATLGAPIGDSQPTRQSKKSGPVADRGDRCNHAGVIGRVTRTINGTLAPGSAGTTETVSLMQQLAVTGSRDRLVQTTARGIIQQSGATNVRDAVLALFHWVRDRVLFAADPIGLERIQAPWVTLARRSGDCDDKSTLLAAMIRAAGLRVPLSFRVIATDRRAPLQFSHVYVIVRGTRPLALDPTHAGTPAGWQVPDPFRLADFAV